MQIPQDAEHHDLELLAYFAEQKGWHDIAEQISEEVATADPADEAAIEAHWQKFFQAFDEQSDAA
jgi:hypothetical protein